MTVTCIVTRAGDPSPAFCYGANVTESADPAATPAVFAKTPKRRSLHQGELGELVLSFYPAGHHMAEHAHDVDQRSIILSGALAEDTPSNAATPGMSHIGFKAAGVRHENRYSAQGALILALNSAPDRDAGPGWGWAPSPWASQIGAVLSAARSRGAFSEDALTDLLALMSGAEQASERPAPGWLVRVREAVRADPDGVDLQVLANEAGVHRVHLSRAYSRHFNAPISVERRRVRMGRAVQALLEDEASPAHAAFEAGFADQPHFARTLRAETGLTPRGLVRVFTDERRPAEEVTSVQDRTAAPAYRAAS